MGSNGSIAWPHDVFELVFAKDRIDMLRRHCLTLIPLCLTSNTPIDQQQTKTIGSSHYASFIGQAQC